MIRSIRNLRSICRTGQPFWDSGTDLLLLSVEPTPLVCSPRCPAPELRAWEATRRRDEGGRETTTDRRSDRKPEDGRPSQHPIAWSGLAAARVLLALAGVEDHSTGVSDRRRRSRRPGEEEARSRKASCRFGCRIGSRAAIGRA